MLYAHAAQLNPDTARLAFEMAREQEGTWTLNEFKGWFNYHCPGCARAGAFAALYVFYALYLAIRENDRVEADANSGAPPINPPLLAAPCCDPKGSVVDSVFAKAEERAQEKRAHAPTHA